MFLNATNIIYDFLQEVEKSVLNESHGVFNNYVECGIEMYNILSSIKPELINSGIYKYSIKNYAPKIENNFIEEIDVDVFLYLNDKPKTGSEFIYNDDNKSDLNKNLKLRKAKFVIRLMSKTPSIDENDFMLSFTHELHHAYRYWSILKNNNNSIPESDFIRDRRYNNIFLRKSTLNSENWSLKLLDNILSCFYFLDSNEVNSYCAEAYEYIREHKDLNLANFHKRLAEFQMFNYLNKCYNTLSDIDEKLFNEKYKHITELICKDAYKTLFENSDNLNESKCTILLKQYFSRKILKANKQFFRTVKKALFDFNRQIKENWNFGNIEIPITENIELSKQMNEILNK